MRDKKKKHEDEAPAATEEAAHPGKTMDEADVKKPELKGHKKEEYGKPKYGSTVNSKTEDIGKPPETEE